MHFPKIQLIWDSRAGPVIVISMQNKKIGLALICHRKEERCIEIFGHTSPLCARCTGIFAGIGAMLLINMIGLTFSMPVRILLVLPLPFDGLTQLLGFRQSNNVLRFMTGLLFSLGMVQFVI